MRRSPFNNTPVPQGNDWFDWLPRKTQCALLLLLLVPLACLFAYLGMHCLHTGRPIALGNTQEDFGDWFIYAAIDLAICVGIFGTMVGWWKASTPHISETHHPRRKD